MLKEDFHIAVPTAFFENEELNVEGTIDHIKNLMDKEVRSFLICGTTGEQHSLSLEEKLQLLDGINQAASIFKEVECIFGVASTRQKEAERLVEEIEKANAVSGILLGFPPYIRPTQQEAEHYILSVANRISKPIILYNNPARTGFDLSIETFKKVIEKENIIGMKEAGDYTRVPKLTEGIQKEIVFYAGGEVGLREKVNVGFNRLSSIAGNLYPEEVKEWFEELLSGEEGTHSVEADLNALYKENVLPYMKEQIAEKYEINIGKCRTPIGN